MSDLHKVAQQALEALEDHAKQYPHMQKGYTVDAITALRAALAQPVPTNQCGETCERAKLCAICARGIEQEEPDTDCHAQEEQEPVAWRYQNSNTDHVYLVWEKGTGGRNWTPLYTHPPRCEWQGLTNEEIDEGRVHLPTEDLCGWSFRQGVIFAEQALKEKNHE